jgi:hypothetical protein
MTECLKEVSEEDLCLALFVAGDALPAPFGEVSEFPRVRHLQ